MLLGFVQRQPFQAGAYFDVPLLVRNPAQVIVYSSAEAIFHRTRHVFWDLVVPSAISANFVTGIWRRRRHSECQMVVGGLEQCTVTGQPIEFILRDKIVPVKSKNVQFFHDTFSRQFFLSGKDEPYAALAIGRWYSRQYCGECWIRVKFDSFRIVVLVHGRITECCKLFARVKRTGKVIELRCEYHCFQNVWIHWKDEALRPVPFQ